MFSSSASPYGAVPSDTSDYPWASSAIPTASGALANEEDEDDAPTTSTLDEPLPPDVIELPRRPASLDVHPLHRTRWGSRPPQLDPVAEALAFRAWQAQRGEPTSPLSPRTLQRLAAAVSRGVRNPFDGEGITADDILAPSPLAIGWYPRNPYTTHADRKRRCDDGDGAYTGTHPHAVVTAEEDGGSAQLASPWKRVRYDRPDGEEGSVTQLPSPLPDRATPRYAAAPAAAVGSWAGHKRQRPSSDEENDA